MSSPAPRRLFLIDTFGLIFRAFYGRARAPAAPMRTSKGVPTEAVYILTNMLRRLLDDHRPDYVAAVWEGAGPTFRDELFPAYKANRDETPAELIEQLPLIRRLLEASRIPVLSRDGFEADDVIGTLARQAAEQGVEVRMVSSDKDLLQLVGEGVYLLNPMKNDLVLDGAGVEEQMGVKPSQVIDFLALKGDSVDNIPGAPGIGDKGARDLISQYGNVEGAIEHAAEVKRKTYRESLQQNSEQILLSKKLATIAVDAPIELDLEALAAQQPDAAQLAELFRELEFNTLLSKLEAPADKVEIPYRTFSSVEEFQSWLADNAAAGHGAEPVAIAVRAGNEVDDGLAVCVSAEEACLLPASMLGAAASWLGDRSMPKRVHDGKAAAQALRKMGAQPAGTGAAGIELAGVADDTRLAAFLADSSRADYSLDKLAPQYLGVPSGGGLGEAAALTRRLGEKLAGRLDELDLRKLYEEIELPLTPVLDAMERAGVLLDSGALAELSKDMDVRIATLAAEIHSLAGSEFNINSPKQLAKVLFEDLNLPAPGRRGKTKTPSTAADVLETLAAEHEIAARVIDYRRLTKLKGTYVDALPALVNPATGRLHTTFNPTGSATGRLSSSNPNLQNIPVRTELGRRIRAAFLAREGWNLVAADYSQIELRVLAHLSGDAVLIDAFLKGEDIHTRTAAEVFGVPPLLVGAEERRRAKAVNFGIVYGLSAFGLSRQLDIPVADARRYIDAYFERYQGVKKYIDATIRQVRQTGVTRTMFGRLRPIPDINAKNPTARGFSERTAVNSPIQGSAADLMKLAMIRADQRLRREGSRAVMLLQVHDELLLEVPEDETAAAAKLVKQEMENVHKLKVPLPADVKAGKNWRDMTPL